MPSHFHLHQLARKAEQVEGFLKAMASQHRLVILCELHKGEISVTPLQKAVGLNQSSLSQHLARLRADGLVNTRRESQTIYYSLADDSVASVIALLHDLFCGAKSLPRPAKKVTGKKSTKRAAR